MAFTAIVGTAKVELVGHHTTTLVPIVMVLHVKCGNAPSQAYLQAIADAFGTQVAAGQDSFPNTYVFDFCRVTDLNTATGPQATGTTGLATPGTADAADIPQACCVVKYTTAKRGRSYRGRSYWPIPTDSVDASGVIAGATLTRIIDFFDDIDPVLAALVPAAPRCVASRHLGTSEVITVTLTESLVGTQRRRVGR